jgi:hypothetical protein
LQEFFNSRIFNKTQSEPAVAHLKNALKIHVRCKIKFALLSGTRVLEMSPFVSLLVSSYFHCLHLVTKKTDHHRQGKITIMIDSMPCQTTLGVKNIYFKGLKGLRDYIYHQLNFLMQSHFSRVILKNTVQCKLILHFSAIKMLFTLKNLSTIVMILDNLVHDYVELMTVNYNCFKKLPKNQNVSRYFTHFCLQLSLYKRARALILVMRLKVF